MAFPFFSRQVAQTERLLSGYRLARSLPACELLAVGAEPLVVRFGALCVDGEGTFLLPVQLLNRSGTRRVQDWLGADGTFPHLTVGRFAEGGGRVVHGHSRDVVMLVSRPPQREPGHDTLVWDRSGDVVRTIDASFECDRLNESPLFFEAARDALDAEIFFDHERLDSPRAYLVGGAAHELYRGVQRALSERFELPYVFDLWAQGEGRAHISLRYASQHDA